jgi:hypothetical protein
MVSEEGFDMPVGVEGGISTRDLRAPVNPFFSTAQTASSITSNQPSHNHPQGSWQSHQTSPRRRLTKEDIQTFTALHVKGIPDELNKYNVLKKHFQTFGQVEKLTCVPAKKFATVQFGSNLEAAEAKRFGTRIGKVPVQLFWHKPKGPMEGGGRGRGRGRDYHGHGDVASISSSSSVMGVPWGRGFQPYTPSGSTVSGSDLDVLGRQEVNFEKQEQEVVGIRDPRKRSAPSVFDRLGSVVHSTPPAQEGEEWRENTLEDPGMEDVEYAATTSRKKTKEDEYFPGVEDSEQVLNDEEEDRNMAAFIVREPRLEQIDHTHEMDTVAKYVSHPYNLRSIHHADRELVAREIAGINEGGLGSSTAKDLSLQSAMMMASLPLPPRTGEVASLPLPPHPGGTSSKELYEALEQRDKGMRDSQSSSSHSVLIGTCPDMCPEKERYLREYQRRLSRFEVLPGTDQVDHIAAVKEYSKSAADQDRPLPHDVRPQPVLQMTMDYLIVEIVDLYGRVPQGEWYDFLWDRMRSVRKDITLQQLSTPEAAELLEKCARYHILCSYLLSSEEDLSVYDPTINQEHLMKSIQSLIETYRELRIQGVSCRNEAEFCCYDILLHLTSGDALGRVAKYSPAVLDSPQVKFAIKVASSMENGNFVRFFKLCRSASFLNSCVLFRYFRKLRMSALGLLNSTHIPAKRTKVDMDQSVLARMLGLQQEQIPPFCQAHGLEVDETWVFFQKDSFTAEGQWAPSSEPDLVDSKCAASYGEIVYGGPLPALKSHTPQCSFGQHGTPRAEKTFSLQKQVTNIIPGQLLETVVDDLVASVIGEEVRGACGEELHSFQALEMVSEEVCADIVVGVVSQECLSISQEEYDSALKDRALLRNILECVSVETVESVLLAVVDKEAKNVVLQTYSDTLTQAEEQAKREVQSQVVEDVVVSEVEAVVKEQMATAKEERKSHLEALRAQVLVSIQQRYWRKWMSLLQLRRRVLEKEESFPVVGSLLPLQGQVDALGVHSSLHTTPLVLQTARDLLHYDLDLASQERLRMMKLNESSLDLKELLSEHLLEQLQGFPHLSSVDWSLLVIRAGSHFSPDQLLPWKWLLRKFSQTEDIPDPACKGKFHLLSRVHWKADLHPGSNTTAPFNTKSCLFNLCVKGFSGDVSDILMAQMKGSSAVIMLLPWQPDHKSNKEFLHACVSSLRALDNKLAPHPPIPVVVLVEKEEMRARVLESLESENWKFTRISVDVFPVDMRSSSDEGLSAVLRSLKWLATNFSPVDLVGTGLERFLHEGLVNLFMSEVVRDDRLRMRCGATPQGFQAVVSLYNAAVGHLGNMAARKDLQSISYPCEELAVNRDEYPTFLWNSSANLDQLQKAIGQFALHLPEPSSPDECITFLKRWMDSFGSTSHHILVTRVEHILKRWSEVWCTPQKHTSEGVWHSMGKSPPVAAIPWAKVIVACAQHCVYEVDPAIKVWLPRQQMDEGMAAFQPPSPWKQALLDTAKAQDSHFSFQKEQEMASRSLLQNVKKRLSASARTITSPSVETTSPLSETNKLKPKLEHELAVSLRFDEQLRLALDDGPLVAPPKLPLVVTPPGTRTQSPSVLVGGKRPHSASASVGSSLENSVDRLVKELKRARHHTTLLETKLQTVLDAV